MIKLEYNPFKFTKDYLEILGGFNSPTFYYFRMLLLRAFEIFKKYSDDFWNLISIMKDSELPCFANFNFKLFKDRFHRFCLDSERETLVDNMI